MGCLLLFYRLEAAKDFAVPLDCAEEHIVGANPEALFSIHRLIYDHLFQRLAIVGDANEFVDITLEMPVVLRICHDVEYIWHEDTKFRAKVIVSSALPVNFLPTFSMTFPMTFPMTFSMTFLEDVGCSLYRTVVKKPSVRYSGAGSPASASS